MARAQRQAAARRYVIIPADIPRTRSPPRRLSSAPRATLCALWPARSRRPQQCAVVASRREMTRRHWRDTQTAERHYGGTMMGRTAEWEGLATPAAPGFSRAPRCCGAGLTISVLTNSWRLPSCCSRRNPYPAGGRPHGARPQGSATGPALVELWGAPIFPHGDKVLAQPRRCGTRFMDASEIPSPVRTAGASVSRSARQPWRAGTPRAQRPWQGREVWLPEARPSRGEGRRGNGKRYAVADVRCDGSLHLPIMLH